MRRPHIDRFLYAGLAIALVGCQQGITHIHEVHYYQVTDGRNTNYLRLTVNAKSKLAVAKYRSGWFPTRSIDQLFGEASSASSATALQTRTDMENLINDKLKAAWTNYMVAASNVSMPSDSLPRYLAAIKNLRAFPDDSTPSLPHSFEIEYDPTAGIQLYHSDEKLVFIFSANPDDIISKIANFSESDNTTLAINRVAGLVSQQVSASVVTAEAQNAEQRHLDSLLAVTLDQGRQAMDTATTAASKHSVALAQLHTILAILNVAQ